MRPKNKQIIAWFKYFLKICFLNLSFISTPYQLFLVFQNHHNFSIIIPISSQNWLLFPTTCSSLTLRKAFKTTWAIATGHLICLTDILLHAAVDVGVGIRAVGLARFDLVCIALEEVANLGLANFRIGMLTCWRRPAHLEFLSFRFADLRVFIHVNQVFKSCLCVKSLHF